MSDNKDTTSRHDQYLLTALVKEEKDFDDLIAFMKGYELTIVKTENLDEQNLSYPINKYRTLLLVSIFFTAEKNIIPTLEKDLRHEETIQRFLLTTWKADPDAPKRASGMRGRRPERETEREPAAEPALVASVKADENVQS